MALVAAHRTGAAAKDGGFKVTPEGSGGVGSEYQRTREGALGWMFHGCANDPDDIRLYRDNSLDTNENVTVGELQGVPSGHYINGRKQRSVEKADFEHQSLQMLSELATRTWTAPVEQKVPSQLRADRMYGFEMFQHQFEGAGHIYAFDLATAFAAAGLSGVGERQITAVRESYGFETGDRMNFEQFNQMCDLVVQGIEPPTPDPLDPPGSPTYASGKVPEIKPKNKEKPPPRKCKEWLETKVEMPNKVKSRFYFKGPGEV